MSQMFNPEMQYGASCVLLGGLAGVRNPEVQFRSWSEPSNRGRIETRYTPPVAGRGSHEICALVRPPLGVWRHGMERVLTAVLRLRRL